MFRAPKPPKQQLTPTIDDAARNEEFTAKLARRRGARATATPGGAAPASVAVKTLLGT